MSVTVFTSSSQLGDEVEAVRVVTPLEVFDTGVQGLKQLSPLLQIEIIIDGKQLGAIR